MKKKALFTILSLFCAAAGAVGLSACDMFGGGKSHTHDYDTTWDYNETHHWHKCLGAGDCNAEITDYAVHTDADRNGQCDVCYYSPMTVVQDAPVKISYYATDTTIMVYDAYYDADKTKSAHSEYRLDGGEWRRETIDYEQQALVRVKFTDLTPGSTHTLEARNGAWEDRGKPYAASEPFAVTVTLEKTKRTGEYPEADKISYEITGKTVVFTLSDGIELSLDNNSTYSAEKTITHTYPESGEKSIRIRYAETATHTASSAKTLTILVTDFASGYGTKQSPYIINNLEQFKAMRKFSKNESYFELTADITCDAEVLGSASSASFYIDGKGHKIISPKLNYPLFYSVREAKNLTIENAEYRVPELHGGSYPAILADTLNNAENVSVSGTITVDAYNSTLSYCTVGGICANLTQQGQGKTYGIKKCSADVTVSLPDFDTQATPKLYLSFGGLAGKAYPSNKTAHNEYATITQCSAKLNVTATATNAYIGGLVGGLNETSYTQSSIQYGPAAKISNCYTTGSVNVAYPASKLSYSYIGGIAPEITGNIEFCYSTIAFSVEVEEDPISSLYVGGICAKAHKEAGFDSQELRACLFAGSISVTNKAAAGSSGGARLNVVCADVNGFNKTEDLYYKSGVADAVAGKESVDATGASPVAEGLYKTVAWQTGTLHLADAYWNKTEGQLPTLK